MQIQSDCDEEKLIRLLFVRQSTINERIKNPNFVVSNVGGSNFECILNVPISDLNEEIRKLVLSFISKLKKNFQKWGKYKILIKNAIILQNVENVKI